MRISSTAVRRKQTARRNGNPVTSDENKKKDEKKIKDALKAKAVEVHPKGTEEDIRKKIDIRKKKKKGE